jgi:hypothetical protein
MGIAFVVGSLVFVVAGLLVRQYSLVLLPIFVGLTWLAVFSATAGQGKDYWSGFAIPPIIVIWILLTVIAVAIGRRFAS